MPIARAMPLMFPDDRRCDNLTRQWMLGPWLLTCGYTDELYLPAGRWIDYWTGQEHQGPKQFKPAVPCNRGGPLLVRGGAILVTGPETQYAGQRPCDRLGLEVWPEGHSRYTLTEDDGQTYRYLDGELAVTTITSQADAAPRVADDFTAAGSLSRDAWPTQLRSPLAHCPAGGVDARWPRAARGAEGLDLRRRRQGGVSGGVGRPRAKGGRRGRGAVVIS